MKTLDIIMALCFAASCLSANAQHYAVVNLSVNFLREAPGYTTELGTQALMGDIVEITDEKGYWCKVVTEEPYTAWCTDLGLVRMDAEEIREYKAAPKYICTAWKSTVYSCPSRKSLKICDIVEGDLLRQSRKTVTRRMDIEGKAPVTAMEIQRYRRPVTRKGFAEVVLPDGRKGYVSRKDIMDYRKWEAGCSPTAENIISEAMKFIGVPYLWGGASPNGVDCSGFVRHVFRMNGILLPRNASRQAESGTAVVLPARQESISSGSGNGSDRLAEVLLPGDLLFFGTRGKDGDRDRVSHVGIYIGNGKMIHASHVVRINSLDPDRPDCYEGASRLLGARRIIPSRTSDDR